jgi:threonine dehydrogenase-like Zn-dependent dehydrogenase
MFESVLIPSPTRGDRQRVVVAPVLSGVCGSDIGAMQSWRGGLVPPGWPSHEVLGTVVSAPPESNMAPGALVVGWAADFLGLAPLVSCESAELLAIVPIDGVAIPDHIVLQPLACVEHALLRLPKVDRVAIVGGGAIGGLFARRLRLDGCAVTVFDTVERAYTRGEGIEYRRADATSPADTGERFPVVIECVGHDARTVDFAARLVADGGTLSVFGVPQTGASLRVADLFERNATVVLGTTTKHALSLRNAYRTLQAHPELARGYLTHTFPVGSAAEAYRAAADPDPERCKVGILWPATREEEHNDQASA